MIKMGILLNDIDEIIYVGSEEDINDRIKIPYSSFLMSQNN